jgi:hypothetical protein
VRVSCTMRAVGAASPRLRIVRESSIIAADEQKG